MSAGSIEQREIETADFRLSAPADAGATAEARKRRRVSHGAARRHQATLRAICRMRGSPAVPVIFPKFGFVRPVTGLARWVAFSALNASNRYSILPCFAQERQAPALGERRIDIGEARAEQNVPSERSIGVRGGVGETRLVEIRVELFAFGAAGVEDGIAGSDQVRARRSGARRSELFEAPMLKGRPDMQRDDRAQAANYPGWRPLSDALFSLGRSHTKELTKRCVLV